MRGCVTGLLLLISGAATAGEVIYGSWYVGLSKDAFSDEPRSVMTVTERNQHATFGYFCQDGLAEVRLILPWEFHPREPIKFAVRANEGMTITSDAVPIGGNAFSVLVINPKLISEVMTDGQIAVRVSQSEVVTRDFRFQTSGTLEAATAFFKGCGMDMSEAIDEIRPQL
jgi:hypothetical protein